MLTFLETTHGLSYKPDVPSTEVLLAAAVVEIVSWGDTS